MPRFQGEWSTTESCDLEACEGQSAGLSSRIGNESRESENVLYGFSKCHFLITRTENDLNA